MTAPGDLEVGAVTVLNRRSYDARDPRCPRHLRRICGTCTHFAGDLRAEGARPCGHFQISVTSGKRADNCKRWGRK